VLATQIFQLCQVSTQLFHARGRCEPAVTEPSDALERLALHAPDHDRQMRLLRRQRITLEAMPVEEFARMLDHRAGPPLFHRNDVIVEAGAAFFERYAHRVKLFLEPADADTEHEASV